MALAPHTQIFIARFLWNAIRRTDLDGATDPDNV
jgi:hypothetical protein